MEQEASVLFGDLRGFTSLTAQRGDREAFRIARGFFELVEQQVKQGGGRLLKTYGDGVMTSFDSPEAAVHASVGMQRALQERNETGSDDPLSAGIGLAIGEVVRTADDLFGHTVNLAKRLADLAKGGQIVAAPAVYGRCRNAPGMRFQDLGRRELRGIGQERVYEIIWRNEVARLTTSSDALDLVLTEGDRLVIEIAKPLRERLEAKAQQLLEEAEQEGGIGGRIKRAVGRRLRTSVPLWIEAIEGRAGMELDRPLRDVEASMDGQKLIVRLAGHAPIVLGPSEIDPSEAGRFLRAFLARKDRGAASDEG